MCVCASLKPGTIVRPPASMRRVEAPAIAAIVFVSPTATIRSPVIATACAHNCAGFEVNTFALTMMVLGEGPPAQPVDTSTTSSHAAHLTAEIVNGSDLLTWRFDSVSAYLESEIDEI